MANEPDATPQGQMPALMVSYQELVTIRTQLVGITSQLTACLALIGRVDSMDRRLGKVENILAGKAGETRTWNTVIGFFAGAVTMALGGGAATYLPKFLGWH